MSEEKNSPLGSLLQNVRQGVSNMVGNNGRQEPVINDRPDDQIDPVVDDANTSANQNHPVDADIDSLIQEDNDQPQGQTTTLRDRLAALSGKQKALLGAVIVVGVLAAKNQLEAPSVAPQEPASAQTQEEGDTGSQEQTALLEGEFKSNSGLDSPDGGFSGGGDAVNQEPLQLDLNEVAGETGNAAISTEVDLNPLDTFTPGEPSAQSVPPVADLPAVLPEPGLTPPPTDAQPVDASTKPATTAAEPVAENKPTPPAEAPVAGSPFEANQGDAFGEAILAGEEKQGVDSSNPAPLGQTEISADAKKLAELEALVKEQAASIEQLKSDLAKAQKPVATQQQVSKPKPHVQQKPLVVQSSKPKQAPRPRVCVKAVAQAARNCSTCVAHAFVVSNGTETMVGHGDKLDGYRVSIVGDRLDLQGPEGTEPHKFWSSPKGCSY
ncbi:hypothetical protein SAMN05216178_7038 [Pseudomonas saponiphila]|uniref:Uncharacterized protein n=1 Tax=Pseudomonas saponiphila TaxID=556534 RepID=A0A1H5A889_9PSED|nr:hypothetical protein [Pseudomonas saponiphila]SED38676.1 hypothetical protein SAMN05216178_7038 [Pseudomonas saponiphila]